MNALPPDSLSDRQTAKTDAPPPEPVGNGSAERAFTVKSILFGLLGVGLIAGFGIFNDNHLRQTLLVGNHFPIGAFFFVFVIAFAWNLVFSKLWSALMLRSQELVVVLGMTLAACFVPTSGLFRYFQRQLILPFYYLRDRPLWQRLGVLDYLPGKLFPLDGQFDDTVYMGFIQGMSRGLETMGLADLPLRPWMTPMLYWGPLLVFMVVCLMGLSLLVHRQWVHHEQLSYPLANVATSFFRRTQGRRLADLFYSRLFWSAAAVVFIIHLFRFLAVWFPGRVPNIPLDWRVTDQVTTRIAVFQQIDLFNAFFGSLMFTIVGVSFFLSSEIGLSMGLASPLLMFLGLQFYTVTGKPLTGQDVELLRTGAYVGYALILMYTGRHFYRSVFLKAFGIGVVAPFERESVIGARLTLLAFAGFVYVLVRMGLDWLVALTFAVTLMMLFLVFCRIVCETGIPFLQAGWWPGYAMASIFGARAVGPGPLVYVFWLGTILVQDPRESLMPYLATSLKVAEDNGVRRAALMRAAFVAVLVALVVSFLTASWLSYNHGAMQDGWASVRVPRLPFDRAARLISRMEETGQIESAQAASGLSKIPLVELKTQDNAWVLAGLAAVVLLSLTRFRFSKCPLHPVILLVWGSFPSMFTWYSFLIGWAVRELVVRFGGGRAHQNLKPLFIGLIAGELFAGALSITVGYLYYRATGNVPPVRYHVLPG